MAGLDEALMRVVTLRVTKVPEMKPLVFVLIKLAIQFAKQAELSRDLVQDLLHDQWNNIDGQGNVTSWN
jgi:hypothetical protein